MGITNVIKSTQEQAVAAWVDYLNQQRLNKLLEKLTSQALNFEKAMQCLLETKETITKKIIETNRGGAKGMHGFIAEASEVGIGNARNLVQGFDPEYIWVNNNGPADMLRNGIEIQQKFVRSGGDFSLGAIREHLSKYPDFLENGGVYQIPNDFYCDLETLFAMSPQDAARLVKSGGDSSLTYDNWKKVQDFFKTNDVDISQIEPAHLDYSDVQVGQIDRTLKTEEATLKELDKRERDLAHKASKPSLKEGAQATAVSAAVEGGFSFCIKVSEKLREGKSLCEFTEEDWADVGIETAKGTSTGAIRGASVYALTNFTASPAAVANAVVTASFGIAAQARHLKEGTLSEEDFLVNSQVICLDASVSAVSSILGQVLIPVPVLGAIVGNTAGMFMFDIAKEHLSKQEQVLIQNFNAQLDVLTESLDKHYFELIAKLKEEFQKFVSLIEWAFSPEANDAFWGSVALADHLGVPQEKVLRTQTDIDNYFCS